MIFMLVLAAVSLAADTPGPRDSFVPSTYVQFQKWPLPADEYAKVMAGGTNAINAILDKIEAPMPDNYLWQVRNSVPSGSTGITDAVRNRIISNEIHYSAQCIGAETLKRLLDHDYRFSVDQIDRIVNDLDHPESSVVRGLHDALVQTFGIWFIEGEQWVNKPEDDRKKFKGAWRKFWNQNRDRYGRDLPLIINDLCMDVTVVRTNNTTCLKVVMANQGTNDWDIVMEVPGLLKMSRLETLEWQRVYALVLGQKTLYPIQPAAYVVSMSSRALSPAQIRAIPDRPVHLETVRIPRGQAYEYLLNLKESFPGVNLRGKEVVLSYRTWESTIQGPVWRGELRSRAVIIK